MTGFSDPDAVARYAEGPPRLVPGLADLQRMTALLLAERVPERGRVLVLGAGGGLELRVFADRHPGWSFLAVDPSAPMLALARDRMGQDATRVDWHDGTVDTAPPDPCDGATGILVLHFLPRDARLRTLRDLRARLRPGAPLVVAHHSFAAPGAERDRMLARYAAFAASNGVPQADAARAADGIGRMLPALPPDQDEALLREAGFSDVTLFYAAFTFRGWVATA